MENDLLLMQNLKYREFHKKLIPTVDEKTIIGIPVPLLRSYAKTLNNKKEFIQQLPHDYYEENMVHGLLLCEETDFSLCIENLNAFLPYVDNWAVCDSIRPKCFRKNKKDLLFEIQKWLVSPNPYVVRFAIEMLMVHYLDEDFKREYLQWVACVKSDEYYVNMMIAWYFATALAKQWDVSFPYIAEGKLPLFVHNKTIQKAVDSYRISNGQKQTLKSYRMK